MIKRALGARSGFRNHITELHYGMMLRNDLMELCYILILWNHSMGSYHRIILQNHSFAESCYRNILHDYMTESHDGIMLRNLITEIY